MGKKLYLGIAAILIILLTCVLLIKVYSSKNDPYTTFNNYKIYWEKQEFDKMYDMLSSETKLKVTKENFVDRYKKIYQDIDGKNVKIDFTTPEKQKKNKEEKIDIPFTLSMDYIGGNINNQDYKASLLLEERSKKKDFYINWDENMIFPGMGPEDKIAMIQKEPKRGEIKDRNGKLLGMNGVLISIGIVPKNFMQNKDASIEEMANILDIPQENIGNKLVGNLNPDWFIPIITVSQDKQDIINKLMSIKGVVQSNIYGRVYPGGEALGRLIGYLAPVTADDLKNNKDGGYSEGNKIGKAGIEQVYEKTLKGEKGVEIYISKIEKGKEVRKISLAKQDAKDGETLKLSIDMDLQIEIYSKMKGDSGACSVIDPKTGEVLAQVSCPSYDSNLFSTYIPITTANEWKDKSKDPYVNRFSQVYSPGSTFKIITAAIGLNEKTLDPNEAIEITGKSWQHNKNWGNYNITRVEDIKKPVNLRDAFVHSDNIYFAMEALKIGKDKFIKGCQGFGIGEVLPIDYPIQKSQLFAGSSFKNDIMLADSGYGQGEVLLSSLHLALIYSSLVNNGNIMKPVLEIKGDTKPTIWKEKAINPENINIILEDLIQVVEDPEGTGHDAKIPGLKLAGKTGTPELKKNANDISAEENGWFVSFDSENPKVIVAMMIENVKNRGESHYVVPKVKDILLYMAS